MSSKAEQTRKEKHEYLNFVHNYACVSCTKLETWSQSQDLYKHPEGLIDIIPK